MARKFIRKPWVLFASALALPVAVWRVMPIVEYYRDASTVDTLARVVDYLRSSQGSSLRPGRIKLPADLRSLTADGSAYVTLHDKARMQVFFPISISRVQVDEGQGRAAAVRIQPSGYFYSDLPPSSDLWVDLSNMLPNSDFMSNWGMPPIRPHWWYVEPFEDD